MGIYILKITQSAGRFDKTLSTIITIFDRERINYERSTIQIREYMCSVISKSSPLLVRSEIKRYKWKDSRIIILSRT